MIQIPFINRMALAAIASVLCLGACGPKSSNAASAPEDAPSIAANEPSAAGGAPAGDNQSSRLWEMRRKVQQRAAQRAGTFLEQMNAALSEGDLDGAESALKAAVAQGKMTQEQIDESTGRIQAKQHAKQAAMVARADAQSSAVSSTASSPASSPAASGPDRVTVTFKSAGLLYVTAAELFNVNSGGSGAILSKKETRRETDGALSLFQTIGADRAGKIAGTYKFQATWAASSTPDLLPGGRSSVVTERKQLEGTFEVPAGVRDVVITYDYYSPNKFRVYTSKY